MNTLAYAVFAENGNIQIWSSDPIQAETLRQKHGNDLVSLIDRNELSALGAAFRAYDAIPKPSSHFSTPEKDKAMALVVREVAMLFHGRPTSDIKDAGLHGDVARIVQMLESREWADHVTKTSLGDRLHSEVSELLDRLGSPAAAQDVAGLVEAADAALREIQDIMHEAYNSAYPVCCGRSGQECCGSPDPEWSAQDQRMIDRLAPHQRALHDALAAHQSGGAK